MKKYFGLLFVLVIAISLVAVTGCNAKVTVKGGIADFKNPKSIKYKTDKGTMKLTYDDDGTYEVVENDPYVTLKNKDGNFRIDMDYSSNTIKQQEQSKNNFKKDKNYTIIDDLEYNGYKGYAMIQNEYGTANIYLTLDEKNEVISNIKVSAVTTEEIKGKPEDAYFNNKKVQKTLKTLEYKK